MTMIVIALAMASTATRAVVLSLADGTYNEEHCDGQDGHNDDG